jgi:hypothetical protein
MKAITTTGVLLLVLCSTLVISNNNDHKYKSKKRVLVLIPFNARSHKNMFIPIINQLSHHGHQVDVISFFRNDEEFGSNPNVTEFVIKLDASAPDYMTKLSDTAFNVPYNGFYGFMRAFEQVISFCEYILTRDVVKNFLRDLRPGVYNIVLLDSSLCECFLPLVHLADAPLVLVSPSHPLPWNYDAIGTSINYAQVLAILGTRKLYLSFNFTI